LAGENRNFFENVKTFSMESENCSEIGGSEAGTLLPQRDGRPWWLIKGQLSCIKWLVKFQYLFASFIENSPFWISMLQTLELALPYLVDLQFSSRYKLQLNQLKEPATLNKLEDCVFLIGRMQMIPIRALGLTRFCSNSFQHHFHLSYTIWC